MATETANKGVAFMAEGKFREAIQHYLHRLRVIALSLSCNGAGPGGQSTSVDCEDPLLRTFVVGVKITPSLYSPLFMRAFQYEDELTIPDSQSAQEQDLVIRSSVVLFNIGLCFHMLSHECPRKRASYQRQAMCFYEESIRAIQAFVNKFETSVAVFYLAALANMASVCENRPYDFAFRFLIESFHNTRLWNEPAECSLPEEMQELKSILHRLGFSSQCHAGAA